MNKHQEKLLTILQALRDLTFPEPSLVYRLGWDFVLQHGKWYEIEEFPPEGPTGLPKQCFGNSIIQSAMHGFKYVEGYALPRITPLAIHHGWNSYEGKLLDVTWRNTGLAYFGVEFHVERAQDATWNGDASILHDDKRGWPLFKEKWQGEREDWPESDIIGHLRRNDRDAISHWFEQHANDVLTT